MESFEFFIKEQQHTIQKLVIKNKSEQTKLFKVMQANEMIRLLVIKGQREKEVVINGEATHFTVTEVVD